MARVRPIEQVPKNRMVTLSVTVRPPEFRCPDTDALKKELFKKYPIERIQMRGKNPPDPNGSIHLFIVVYLVKEVLGPTLRQIVKDAYAYVKKQMTQKNAKKLELPPAFIHNGSKSKKRQSAKRKIKPRGPREV